MLQFTVPPSPVSLAQQIADGLSGNGESVSQQRGLSRGQAAVFWCFARQDMLSAFMNNTSTRLETSDLPMWRSAGLKITSEGYVCPSNPQHPDYNPEHAMSDDMICNAFGWLLCKLVNFIVAGDDLPDAISPLSLGVRQRELLDYWEGLHAQINAWYAGLPDSFRPTAIQSRKSEGSIDEKWFPRPMCASAMQWFHFARIQLLHNKPHVTTAITFPRRGSQLGNSTPGASLAARHASYAAILQQSREHAKEIVSIGLGRSDEGTRVHSVQPLWTAGLVLGMPEEIEVNEETWMWRRSILSQLRGIEWDMGWASEYRVQSLLELWGLPSGWDFDS